MLKDLHANLLKTQPLPSLHAQRFVHGIESIDVGVHHHDREITVILLGRFIDVPDQEQKRFTQRSVTMAKSCYYRVGSGYIRPWGSSNVYASVFCGTASRAGRRYIVDMTGGIDSLEGIYQQADMHGSGLHLTRLMLERLLIKP